MFFIFHCEDIVLYFGLFSMVFATEIDLFWCFSCFLFLQGHLSSSQLFIFWVFLFLLFGKVMYVNEVNVWFEKPTNSLLTIPKVLRDLCVRWSFGRCF